MIGTLVVAATSVAFLAVWHFTYGSKLDSMHVEALDPPNDPWLVVELKHKRSFEDGTEYWFNRAGSLEHVVSTFDAQHPEGVVTTANPEPVDTRDGVWHLSRDDIRFDLVFDPESGWFELATQAVVVHPAAGGQDMRIPFPRSAFRATEIEEGQTYTNSWVVAQWADFYKDVGQARVEGETITVPTNRRATATITVSDGLATVTLND